MLVISSDSPDKEAANIVEESKKLEDLDILKGQNPPGPFTSSEEVKTYMDQGIPDEIKLARLYREVRYARKTSLSLPESAEVFRRRRKGANLPITEYGDNLISYLDKSRSAK